MKDNVWICYNCHQSNDDLANQCVTCECKKTVTREQNETEANTEEGISKNLINSSELILVLFILMFVALFDYLPISILRLFGLGIIFFGFIVVNRRWRKFFLKRKL